MNGYCPFGETTSYLRVKICYSSHVFSYRWLSLGTDGFDAKTLGADGGELPRPLKVCADESQ